MSQVQNPGIVNIAHRAVGRRWKNSEGESHMAEEEGALDKLKNSVMGVLLGLVLIPASFVVVWYASQREQASEELAGAFSIEEIAKAKEENKAVYSTGTLKAPALGEPGVIKPGNFLELRKSRQMYGYKNVEKSRKVGEKTEKYYVCEMDWLSNPQSSADGKQCAKEGRVNPAFAIPEYSASVDPSLEVSGKTYTISKKDRDYVGMPSASVTEEDMIGDYPLSDGKFYENDACASSPTVGCERFSYSGTAYDPAGEHTVVGMLEGSAFEPFKDFLLVGAGDYKTVMAAKDSEDTMMTWVLFAAAVLCLGGGLSLLVGPLLTLIEFIPIIGDFGAGLIRFVFFAFAFVAMGITFLLIEYWWLVLILFILAIVAILFIAKGRKSKAA